MKIKSVRNPFIRSKGVTLIEILMVIGLLVILLSFAVPSVSGTAAKAELKVTLENVEYSIQAARNMARVTESSVSLNLQSAQDGQRQSISFSSSAPGRNDGLAGLPDYQLPAEIVLVSDHESFVFNAKGLVDNPGKIVLASRVDETVRSVLDIE